MRSKSLFSPVRGFRFALTLSLVAGVFLPLAGCVMPVPCSPDVWPEGAAVPKRAGSLAIVMSEELRTLAPVIKPFDMAMAQEYRLDIGPALEANLATTMGNMFPKAWVTSLPVDQVEAADYILIVEQPTREFDLAASIFGTHNITLTHRYQLYDGRGLKLAATETVSVGTGKTPTIGGYGTADKYRLGIGMTYNNAMANSLEQLVAWMAQTVREGGVSANR